MFFLGKQFFKIVGGLISIIIGRDLYTSNDNPMGGDIVYRLNSNNFTRILILLHNCINPLEKFVGANYLIYLVIPLIICPSPMFF